MIYSHMHNVYFQQLVCAGLPGLALFLVLTLLLLRRMPACVRHEVGRDTKPMSILSFLLVAVLLYSTMEPLLSPRIGLATIVFCTIAGVLVAESEGMVSEEAEQSA